MQKTIILLLFLFMFSGIVSAEILPSPFEPLPFEDEEYIIYIFPWLDQTEPSGETDQHYDFSFRDKDGRFEVRYTMFNQAAEIENRELSVYTWAWMVAQNIIQSEELFNDFSAFGLEDVSKEFNADYGLTTFARTTATDWTDEYDFMLINFYFKEGIGVMCQTLMFRDVEQFQTEDFMDLFHSFRFQ